MPNNNAYPNGKCNDMCGGGHLVLRESWWRRLLRRTRERLDTPNG